MSGKRKARSDSKREAKSKRRKVAAASALHEAVKHGDLNKVRDLLKRQDLDVDAKDSKGLTPFALAATKRYLGVMRSLLKAGADPRQEFKYREVKTTAAFLACDLADRDMLEIMLQSGITANDVSHVGFKDTLLVRAVSSKYEKAARGVASLLLEHGATVDAMSGARTTALHEACSRRNIDMARMLLKAGARVDVRNSCGETPLCTAFRGHYRVDKQGSAKLVPVGRALVELMLQFKAEVTQTVVMDVVRANFRGKLAMLRLLVSHGADFCSQPRTVLKLEMDSGSNCAKSVKLLLDHGADPNGPEDEASPLHMACRKGHRQIAKALLDAGARVDFYPSFRMETPLFYAVTSSSPKATVDLLLERGANVNWRKRGGVTPLHLACLMHTFEPARFQIIRLLIENGADVNAQDDCGDTPLHWVTKDYYVLTPDDDHKAAVATKTLLKAGADVEEVQENSGATPFVGAMIDDLLETGQELFEFKWNHMPQYDDDE